MNNIAILQLLLEHKEKKFTINQIAKTLHINYRIAHEQTKLLEQEQLITMEKAGKALLCSLTGTFNEKIYLAEYQRRKQLLQHKDFKTIHKRFSEAKQNYILLLFGSQAKGTATTHSDIDLLAITEDDKEIKEIAQHIPKKIHLTTTNYATFTTMIHSKKISVGTQAQKNNIILLGIEDYYRLLQHAQ